jgi:transcriptional regulator with XRE-family HTH domain
MQTKELRACTISAAGPTLWAAMPTIGENIRALREAKGISQGTLADAIGVPQPRLSDWETSRYKNPDLGNVLRVAKGLKVSIDQILKGTDPDYDSVIESALRARAEPVIIEVETPEGATDFVPLPILSNRIAAGNALAIDPHDIAGYAAFSPRLLDRLKVKPADAVLVRVGWVQRSMAPTIKPDDVVLLDCSESTRTNPQNGDIYAVNFDDGSALKRVVIVGNLMSLVSDNLDKAEYPILPPMDITDRFIQGLIVGRAVWWGNALL